MHGIGTTACPLTVWVNANLLQVRLQAKPIHLQYLGVPDLDIPPGFGMRQRAEYDQEKGRIDAAG